MKKIKINKKALLMSLMLISYAGFAANVSEQQANTVAENFMKSKTGSTSYKAILHYLQNAPDGSANLYVFNFLSQKGFVIVTGDNRVKPVIAYSTNNNFDISIAEKCGVNWWMNKVKMQMEKVKKSNLQPDPSIVQQWNAYLSGTQVMSPQSTSVGPLLTTEWAQGSGYNSLCPSNGSSGQCPTGCVATAMAQIMKYWNYPPHGTGSHSYTDNDGSVTGTHSANFGNTDYNWSNMPLTSGNADVATLMYQCGVAVEMDYDSAGSGACMNLNVLCSGIGGTTAKTAFEDNFGYAAIDGKTRAGYLGNWPNMLKDELDLKHPIQYAAVDPTPGPNAAHSWVVDGYDNSDNFHMNWGWGGSSNGYYYDIDDLSPNDDPPLNFTTQEAVLIDIRPANLSDCNDHYNLSGTQNYSYYYWQASDYISSSKYINNKFCSYTANNYIVLNSGFEAKGSDINLTAKIQPCIAPRIGGNSSFNTPNAGIGQNILSVFPNPAHHSVIIAFTGEDKTNYHIILLDMLGRTTHSQNGSSTSGNNEIKLNLESLPSGIYYVQFISGDVREVKKLVIE